MGSCSNQEYSETEKYYLQEIETGSVDAMNNLGLLYANQGKLLKAEKYWSQAVENGHIEAMRNLGILYKKQEKFSEAEKCYLQAIEI